MFPYSEFTLQLTRCGNTKWVHEKWTKVINPHIVCLTPPSLCLRLINRELGKWNNRKCVTEQDCLVHGLMCHHIRFMDVSSLVSVLKLCKLLCRRCTQISGCLDCSLFSHPSVWVALIMKAIIGNLILTKATKTRLISGMLACRHNP